MVSFSFTAGWPVALVLIGALVSVSESRPTYSASMSLAEKLAAMNDRVNTWFLRELHARHAKLHWEMMLKPRKLHGDLTSRGNVRLLEAAGPISQTHAEVSCSELGGVLATPLSPSERHWFHYAMVLNGRQPVDAWIGLNDRDAEGEWRTANGYRLAPSQMDWRRRQPDNHGSQEHCTHMSYRPENEVAIGGKYNDYVCSLTVDSTLKTQGYFCRFP